MTLEQPVKTTQKRVYRGIVTDSARWQQIALRADDVIVTTPPKSGTTWMLHLVMMLILGKAEPDAGNARHAPWIDAQFMNLDGIRDFVAGLTRRRCLKSHTALDGLPYGTKPTYIAVYRHPVDVHFSMRAHADNMKAKLFENLFPDDERVGFQRFVDHATTDASTDDLSVSSIVDHYLSVKEREKNGNVHLFHYADLTRDLRGQIGRLARLLAIDLPDDTRDQIAQATTFASMRKAAENDPRRFTDQDPYQDLANFYATASSGKWEGRLTDDDMARYAHRISQLLPPQDVAWLENGSAVTAL